MDYNFITRELVLASCKYYKGEKENPFTGRENRFANMYWHFENMFYDRCETMSISLDESHYGFLGTKYPKNKEGLSSLIKTYVVIMCGKWMPYDAEMQENY